MRATSRTNRSAKGGARSSPHYGGEGVLTHPSHQGVCGRHGTEDQGVTPGELPASSSGSHRVSLLWCRAILNKQSASVSQVRAAPMRNHTLARTLTSAGKVRSLFCNRSRSRRHHHLLFVVA